jgi:carbon starvation protein
VKNKGKSIGYLIELYVGKSGKRLFLIFVWLFSILVAAAFADIVAGTFAGFNASGESIATNASVTTTSALFIPAAISLGFFIRKRKASDLASGIIAVDLLFACIVFGILFPMFLSKAACLYSVFGYIFIASVLPIWTLGQPRNYLNSFLLVAMIVAAFFGVAFTNPTIELPAFVAFTVNGNYLFPVLFVTIACGAISGIHSLVVTGTSSKQISNERYMLPISYGSMLTETLVAVLALISVGSLSYGGVLPREAPPVVFATAVSSFLYKLGLPHQVSFTIVSLAISSFILTTLDTVARLGRLSFQELFSFENEGEGSVRIIKRIMNSKLTAAVFTLVPACLLAVFGYQNIWTLFGTANQLLAALTLIACTMFFKKTGRRITMLLVPTISMLVITFTSLILTINGRITLITQGNINITVPIVQMGIATLLLILGILVTVFCAAKLLEKTETLPKNAK